MWSTLSLVVALGLSAGQNGSLELTNVRSTYGLLGATRAENKILPGDMFFVAFDIDNVQADPNGRVLYSMAMEVTDGKGKIQFKQDPRELEAVNSLGGNRLPAFAHVDIGLDQPPGQYTLKVTVTDRTAKKTQAFERPFQVLERGFGIVRLGLSSDPNGQSAAPNVGVVGQSLWINFLTVGLAQGGANKEPDIGLEMQVTDESGKPTLSKPFTGEAGKDLPKDIQAVPMQFLLALNRPGKFTIHLKATDRIAKKNAELAFPVTVMETK
jgi:hypothetical protein